ncbi:hypothetical protein [Nocardioides jensenii]|uniref:hypothetical protein n=1 Tax=Nocardioides jensenii TaxID=1843 RepID=UPI00082AECC5|nr:hypothetical protein [Nocardioides jensenii]
MSAALVSALVAVAFVMLARWGQRNVETLVPAGVAPARRDKDARAIRRGARSCLVIGILFAAWSVVLTLNLAFGLG